MIRIDTRRQASTQQTTLQAERQERSTGPRRERLLKLSIFVALLAALITCPSTWIYAQPSEEEPVVTSFEQHDLDGDAAPDQAIILVYHMGHRHKVVVYDQGGDMPWSDDWQQGTDFANDVWLFQDDESEQTKLIIRFGYNQIEYTAELFDDATGDGTVASRVEAAGQVRITESELPRVRFTAEQPWIMPDGTVNYMVQITAYSRLDNMLSGIGFPIETLPQDGRLAWSQEIVDLNSDSIPDYELIQVFPDIPQYQSVYRTSLNINIAKKLPVGFQGALLWPYLGCAEAEGWTLGYLERKPDALYYAPPIWLDAQGGRILGVSNFLAGYGTGDRYGFLSMTHLEKNQINELHFDRTGHYYFSGSPMPDMFFRLIRQGAHESVQVGSKTLYAEQVGFNWHHRNLSTLQWDYKLELAGLYESPTTLMDFKDFSLRDVPFEELLWWFTARECGYATFVAAEERGYASNEGIWEWMTLWGVVTDVSEGLTTIPGSKDTQVAYILGESTTSPAQYYEEIREGFRGEYGEINELARLYFSPIDHKLHLQKAQQGVWNLGGSREIRYYSLGSDYIDRWTLIENSTPIKDLYHASGYLVYDDSAGVQVIRTDTPRSLFTALPPRSQEEWVKLGESLDMYQPGFDADDFAAMIRQFDGEIYSLPGASLSDFRLLEQGFRFILHFQGGFGLVSYPEAWRATMTVPGVYAVSFDGSTWEVKPSTPPEPHIAELTVGDSKKPLQALEWTTIKVTVDNHGLEDIHDLAMCAKMMIGDDQGQIVTRTVDLLPAEGSVYISWDWVPPSTGSWRVQVQPYCGESLQGMSSEQMLSEVIVQVYDRVKPSAQWLMTIGGRIPQPIVLFLLTTVAVGWLVAAFWTRQSSR